MSVVAEPYSDYKLDVTEINIDRETLAVGGTTRHDTGGRKATAYLGTWVRQRYLARGASGVVYLERNLSTGRHRAVKRLEGGDTEAYDREIAQLVRVKGYSKLFVDFFSWYTDKSYNIYIAMEYHAGGDLKGHVDSFGPFTEAEAKVIAQQVLQGVFVLHELNISHRDIKPENILIVSTNPVTIKIADFGQAMTLQGSYQTPTGTSAWRAPEVASGYYDKTADLWSVGCVVYYLLTALNPFLDYPGENEEHIQQFTFQFWPRLQKFQFQAGSDDPRRDYKPKHGDQIVVKGISNIGNEFLKGLVVLTPSRRISAYKALNHPWICQTSPLQAALQNGDFRLARLLSTHDPRYNSKWERETSEDVALVVLRVAAASGQTKLMISALKHLPLHYEFKYNILSWPVKPALLGAATLGSLHIVELLLDQLRSAEQSHKILLQACKAALQGGHQQVVNLLWPRLCPRDRAWDYQLGQDLVRYGDLNILVEAHKYWTTCNEPNSAMELRHVRPGDPSTTAYAHHFPSLLECAARHRNTERVQWLLKMRPSSETVIPGGVLRRAIEGGQCDIVRLLLKSYPVEFRARSVPNLPLVMALVDASFYGHMDIVICLVERGIMPSRQAIDEAVRSNHSDIFRYLIDALLSKFKQDSHRVTQYITAAAVPHCSVKLLKWLCTNRLDRTVPGDPVNHVRNAARFGANEIVDWFIIDSGQAPSVITAAIIGASELGHIDIVAPLCKTVTDGEHLESWEGAAKGGHIAILDQLLLTNPNPSRFILGRALKAGAEVNRLRSVLWLLCVGASPRNERGVIVHFGCQPVIQGLLDSFGSA